MGRYCCKFKMKLVLYFFSLFMFGCDKTVSDFVGSVGKINGGGFTPNTSITQPSISTPASLTLNPISTNLEILKPQSLAASGGTPPYNFSILSGVGAVDSSGNVKSNVKGSLRVQVTDASGATATVDMLVNDNTILSGQNVKAVKFNASFSKAVITTQISTNPIKQRIFTANVDLNNGTFSDITEVGIAANIPNLRYICNTFAQLNPAGTKIVFTADTSNVGAFHECEVWSMDFNGQNAIQISAELTDTISSSQDRSADMVTITSDGMRVLYVDGEHANWVDNEKVLKIVDIAGTNRMLLHPLVNSDFGVISYSEAIGQNRVLFTYSNAVSWNDYLTYTARMDGSDSGALVAIDSSSGYLSNMNSISQYFSNYSKVMLTSHYNSSGQPTIEMANVDGTGKVVVQAASGVSIKVLDFDSTTGRIVYYRQDTSVITYTPGTGSATTISGLAGYGFSPIMQVANSKLYYVTSNGQELRMRNLDGTGDTLRSDAAYAGRIRGFFVQPNDDVIYYGDKDVLYSMDIFKSVSGGAITRLTTTPLVGGATGLSFNRMQKIGTSAVYLEVCPGPMTFSPWACSVATAKITLDFTGGSSSTSTAQNYMSGTELFSSALHSIRLINDATGLYIKWFGL